MHKGENCWERRHTTPSASAFWWHGRASETRRRRRRRFKVLTARKVLLLLFRRKWGKLKMGETTIKKKVDLTWKTSHAHIYSIKNPIPNKRAQGFCFQNIWSAFNLSQGAATASNQLNWAVAGGRRMLGVIKGRSDAALTARWWRRVARRSEGLVLLEGRGGAKRKTVCERFSEQQLFLIPERRSWGRLKKKTSWGWGLREAVRAG